MNNIAQQAASLGIDANSLSSVLEYIVRNLKENPGLRARFEANPSEVIAEGVTAWTKMGTDFFNELLENKTERAKEYRAMIAEQTWTKARQNQGLPV